MQKPGKEKSRPESFRDPNRDFVSATGRLLTGNHTMLFERTGHRKLAELVPDHVLGDEHRNEGFPVVDVEDRRNQE